MCASEYGASMRRPGRARAQGGVDSESRFTVSALPRAAALIAGTPGAVNSPRQRVYFPRNLPPRALSVTPRVSQVPFYPPKEDAVSGLGGHALYLRCDVELNCVLCRSSVATKSAMVVWW